MAVIAINFIHLIDEMYLAVHYLEFSFSAVACNALLDDSRRGTNSCNITQ
jgi:hypothetical protein